MNLQFLDQFFQVASRSFTVHDFEHLFTNLTNLGRFSISSLLQLVRATFSEGNSEKTEQVTIGSFNIDVSFDERLPFSDQRAQFVRGEVHAVKVGQTVASLNFLDLEFDFTEGVFLVVVQVSQGEFQNTIFEGVVGVF